MVTSKNKNDLFTAGDFARICGVNKQTLIYYDKTQVFSPCFKDENGCRFYSLEQFDVFNVILALRDIMSLNELKIYTQKRESEYFLNLFERTIDNLSFQISHLTNVKKMMEKKVNIVKAARNIDTTIIYTEYCSREYLKFSPKINHFEDNHENLAALAYIMQYRLEHNLSLGRAIGGIVTSDSFLQCRNDGYIYYYSELPDTAPIKDSFIKPEGNYLICYHEGHYSTTCLSYHKLLDYANKNRYTVGQYIYEESLVDEVVETDAENYIVKISVPFKHDPDGADKGWEIRS